MKLKSMGVLSLVFLTVIFARVNNTNSDPKLTLLVSESIVKNQSIRLDYYGESILKKNDYVVHEKNGHQYYYFPIGASVASIPFVYVANSLGLKMEVWESKLQKLIAAFTAVFTTLLFIFLARLFVSENNSILIGALFWFGTSLASTSGTALWSHNFATLFGLTAIYLAIKSAKQNDFKTWPIIAVLLFASYLSRPTMAILSPLLLIFILTYSKSKAFKCALLLAILVGFFMIFSFMEFGQPFPDYYLPNRLAGGSFLTALYGNLFSPARGLFIYSPFILFAWICMDIAKKDWNLKLSWLLIAALWPILHIIMISRFPHWWGGHSYGPRLMTDVLPGLFLLTLFVWPTHISGFFSKILVGLLLIVSVFSIYVNAGQGLYNPYTAEWNANPNIDLNPELIFDWNYPQFMASKSRNQVRLHFLNTVD
jgi:hypothetical protein